MRCCCSVEMHMMIEGAPGVPPQAVPGTALMKGFDGALSGGELTSSGFGTSGCGSQPACCGSQHALLTARSLICGLESRAELVRTLVTEVLRVRKHLLRVASRFQKAEFALFHAPMFFISSIWFPATHNRTKTHLMQS